MPNPPELVWLDNLTPKSTRFEDTYYSSQSGLDETRYVFIDGNGLPLRWQQGQSPVIGELGFGTGLNFVTTWQAWLSEQNALNASHEDNIFAPQRPSFFTQESDEDNFNAQIPRASLTFISIEKYPMSSDDLQKALSPWPELTPFTSHIIEHWQPTKNGWQKHQFGPVTLHLFIGDADDALAAMPASIDAWYLDGFNPKTNPDLWSLKLMQSVNRVSSPEATLASYTAAGWVRRNLQEAGFTIAKRKGFGHKRHMITGIKTPLLSDPKNIEHPL